MMRTAYICADPGVPVFGCKGSSIHVQSVIRALSRHGIAIDLFAARYGGPLPAGFEDVTCHRLPAPPKGELSRREQALLAANLDLSQALEQAGTFDFVYERYSLWSHAGMEYARAHNLPALLEVNAPLIDEQAEHRGLIDRAGAQATAERAFGAATALLAVSSAVAGYLDRYASTRGRVLVTPNGVDPERFPSTLKATLPADPQTCMIGFVGTLKPWHGLDTLLEAFEELRSGSSRFRLLIVGDGPERARLEANVHQQGLSDSVQFTGAVPPEAIPGLVRSMDVAVAPYPALPAFYFSPLKVYEYMAAGTAVVASRIGQLGELITHERDGLLYTPGDAQELAAALLRLDSDQPLRARLGRCGRQKVMAHHTWDAVAARILRVAGSTR